MRYDKDEVESSPHRFPRKLFCIFTAIVAWAAITTTTRAETVLGLEPSLAMKIVYPDLKGHKAFAISPGGRWIFASGHSSSNSAIKKVLADCKAVLRSTREGKFGDCELVAVDDKMVWTKKPVAPWDEPLPLPDLPLKKAQRFGPDSGSPKGIVLALHGAGNAYGVSTPGVFEKSWFEYLASIGMLVVYPSSFDDTILAYEYAGWNDPKTYPSATKMQMIRVAQTRRTLSELSKSYPGLPIYLWSHSAGGNLAQSIESGIAGAIIVGTQCGLGSPMLNAIPKKVPILYVYGQLDDKIFRDRKKLTEGAIQKFCGKDYAIPTRKFVIAKGEDHLPTIWHQNVLDAVAAMFDQKRFLLKERRMELTLSQKAEEALQKQYSYLPLKKAFAIGKDAYAWSASIETQAQANLGALLACNRYATGFSYPPSGQHECVVHSEGNKVVLK